MFEEQDLEDSRVLSEIANAISDDEPEQNQTGDNKVNESSSMMIQEINVPSNDDNNNYTSFSP